MSSKIMQRFLLILALLLMNPFSTALQAAIVEDLYTIELPVPDQTTSERLAIFNKAFALVLVKVGGSDELLSHPGLKRPLQNSARYVQQFRYQIRKEDASAEFDGGQLFLKVVFNEKLVENLMRENDISVWGKERPSTLLLISFDVNKNKSLVSSDTTTELVEELDDLAQRHGLPVLFPLLDLEDRVILGVKDIIETNDINIDALAVRYAPDAILTGQLIGRAGKGWQGIWRVRFADRLFNWDYKATSREDALNQAVSKLAKTLASEYALQSYQSFDQEVLFSVDQVNAITDHIKVHTYLQSLDAVETVRLVLIEEDKLTYRVKLRNTADDLHRLINLGYVLEQLELPQINAATDDQTVIMNYRYLR
jgi:hypothetical protein